MKIILIFFVGIIFLFVSFEILFRVNDYVLVCFNKLNNIEIVHKENKYKLKIVEKFLDMNRYVQKKSISMVE